MRRSLLPLLFAAAAVPVACSKEAPTAPASAGLQNIEGSQASSARTRVSRRRLVRRIEPRGGRRIALGAWGGRGAELDVKDGGAGLEFDCAHGSIDQPFVVDPSGGFDLAGTFVREHGGPIAAGELPDAHPARYSGQTDGKTILFAVTVTDSGQRIGPFTVTLGEAPRIFKCL